MSAKTTYKPTNTGRATGKGRPFILKENPEPGKDSWALFDAFDWVQAMRQCPQDAIHHAEGDVWTHTTMVVEALLNLPEYQNLSAVEQDLLYWAAVLHDVAKPVCTFEDEQGRIHSPRHAKVGEKIARELLWDCPLDFRERVCALVRLHGLPLWSFEKSDPVRSAILASWWIRNELTWMLAKADVLGRICAEPQDMHYRLDMFRELCLENRCFETEHPWFSPHSRFRYFWSEETYPVEVFDDTHFEVILLSGIAGSGKDSYYQKHFAALPQISLDEIRRELRVKPDDRNAQGLVAQTAYERAKAFCRKKQSFVWNSTNLSADLRARLIQTLRVYDPRFKIVYIETSKQDIYARRKENIHVDVLERMIRQLEVPLVGEAHEVEWVKG